MNSRKLLFLNIFSIALLGLFIIVPFFLDQVWGFVSIEQIISNLETPLVLGDDFERSLIREIPYLATIYLLCVIVYAFVLIKLKNSSFYTWFNGAVYFVVFLGIAYFGQQFKIIGQIRNLLTDSSYIEENYQVNAAEIKWKYKQNLVLIVVESLENTYGDPRVFNPPVTPHLRKLQEDNISFDRHIKTPGTGWTIAGIVSYMFGLPLKMPIGVPKNRHMGESFLSEAISITKIMEDAGYDITFLAGWNTSFSGYDKLISTHSNGNNIDERDFKAQGYTLEKLRGAWGFKDSFVFSEAKKVFVEKVNKKEPFALILNTIDTHFPSGFADKQFKKYNDIRDAYLAADYHVSRFVQEVLAIDKNTTIVIVGDHLSMKNEVSEKYLYPNSEKRTVYNCFINSKTPLKDKEQESRLSGSIDIAPTILESIGCELPDGRFGLGVSLFSENKNLLEKEKETYFEEISKRSTFYNSLF